MSHWSFHGHRAVVWNVIESLLNHCTSPNRYLFVNTYSTLFRSLHINTLILKSDSFLKLLFTMIDSPELTRWITQSILVPRNVKISIWLHRHENKNSEGRKYSELDDSILSVTCECVTEHEPRNLISGSYNKGSRHR